MHNSSEDLRVRRTRMLLQQAMIDLTIEKGFAAVTVSDIAERAMVNRATFYRHYQDKYDLLERFMHEVYELTYSGEGASGADQSTSGLVKLLEHVRERAAFYGAMLGPDGEPSFAHRIQQYIERRLRQYLPDPSDQRAGLTPIDLNLSYASYAGIGVIRWWIKHTYQYTTEQVAIWLNQLTAVSMRLSSSSPSPVV